MAVDKAEYDFGTRDIEASSGSHDFVFTNKGDAPLSLSSGGTSCRCAMSKLGQEKIPPGGLTKVTISWKPVGKPGPYYQTAKINTNDPAQPQITLAVSGRVTAAVRFEPSELVFSRLSVGETSTAESRLFCYRDAPLRILGHTWSDAATARYFDVTQRSLSATELKEEPTAQCGMLVKITWKAGLPAGPVHQALTFQTNTASSPTLSIEGIIGGEITVVGPGWNPDTGILQIGEVPRNLGTQRRLMLVVRGPMRREITFKPLSVAPSVLRVSLGQPGEINRGAVVQVPLIVDIPPGSPPTNRLGTEQGKLGEIILGTTHTQVPKVRILVRFAIEG